jgi:hypothetical protein
VFNVMIAAEVVGSGAAESAFAMSDFDRGEPVTMYRPGRGVRMPGVRTRATTVWPWESNSDTR